MGLWGKRKLAGVPDDEPEYLSYGPLYDEDGPGDPEFGAWLDEKLGLRAEDRPPTQQLGPDTQPKPRTRWWWIKRGLLGFVALFLLLLAWLAITAPLSKSLQPIAPPQLTLLAADGTPIARNGAVVGEPVEVEELPPHVVEAFLAIEDRRFYSHWGIDPRGIARALWSNLTTGRTQGGSTITQQLAKFTFLNSEQSLGRKAREALIALWLEAWLTKDEILERYLSNAYFGDNVYGLRAASLHYFYRKPENLKPEQAAMLAGLLQAPSRLAPTNNPELAERRMRLVIRSMVAAGYLTQAEADALPTPEVDVRNTGPDVPTGTYFADWALPEARLRTGVGYASQTVRTTLDSRLQAAARRAVERAALGGAQVALVAMRPNGEVVAMIGGTDYAKSPFNRATQARRQPGSTFKLFVYLAALEEGWEPDDLISNRPIEQGSYRPRNASGNYSDAITLADAFAQSSNVAAVRLLGQVGDDDVIAMARELGVRSPLAEGDPSLALGTSTMTLMELTAAYAGVAANAYPVKPTAFVADEPGLIESWFDGKDSLGGREHEDIERMLRQAINSGTGRAATLAGPNFGKTGTTQDNRDALFVGYAGGLVVGVWVGNDDNTPLAGISGGGLPARIWKDFMQQALGERPTPARPRPDPSGPVEPQDVHGLEDVPEVGIEFRDGRPVLSSDIQGVPFEVDRDGVRFDREAIQQRAREARERFEERAREMREEAEERMREREERFGP